MDYIRISGFPMCYIDEDLISIFRLRNGVKIPIPAFFNNGGERCYSLVTNDDVVARRTLRSIVDTSVSIDYLEERYKGLVITAFDDIGVEHKFESLSEFMQKTKTSIYDFTTMLNDRESLINGWRLIRFDEPEPKIKKVAPKKTRTKKVKASDKEK